MDGRGDDARPGRTDGRKVRPHARTHGWGGRQSSGALRLGGDTILNASFTQVVSLDVTGIERDPSDVVVRPAARVKAELLFCEGEM